MITGPGVDSARGAAPGRTTLVVGAIVLLLAVIIGITAPALAQDDESGSTLTVEVTDGSTPSPSASAPPPDPANVVTTPITPVPPGRTSTSGATTVEQTTVSDADSASLDDEPGTLDLGVFSISALHASVEPSLSLAGGAVELFFTVRNNSASPFNADTRFWLTSVFGPSIAEADGIPVAGLQPGESRRVAARFENVGNWAFYRGFVTFTPPEVVDNNELVPITRDVDIFVPPLVVLLVVGILLLAAVGLLIWMAATGRLGSPAGRGRSDGPPPGGAVPPGPSPDVVAGGTSP